MNGNESTTHKQGDEGDVVGHDNLHADSGWKDDVMQAGGDSLETATESLTSVTIASGSGQTPVGEDAANSSLDNGVAGISPDLDETIAIQYVDNVCHDPAPLPSREVRSGLLPVWEVMKLFLIPALILSAFVIGIVLLGIAQSSGWIKSAGAGDSDNVAGATLDDASGTTWICPMMCVPPTTKPGRCPVCAMELVPASAHSAAGPSSKIQIDPRSRRVAGIQTISATSQTLVREVRGVGEVSYDEGKLKMLSPWVDGRVEELYASFTGIEVKKGDSLALIYSPDLYGAQIEYVRTLEFTEENSGINSRSADSNRRLLASSRERLIEFGMTEQQVRELENERKPNSRLALHAPMSGTVIEKMVVTGQYIKAGTPVYKLADLSTVWLVLELFPEDAGVIEIGQTVSATTQSMSGPPCEGIVSFVEPTVDPKTRSVGVRVQIRNEDGRLKPGEFVRATLKIPLLSRDGKAEATIVVPRNSLLSIGQTSLVYVEIAPGEFEMRHVRTGPTVDGQVAILEGLAAGENVVAQSTFLLDAQMQLQGNPSLIDPDKAIMTDRREAELTEAQIEEIRRALEPLSEADRARAEAQVICPVTEVRLGSLGMGTPIKLEIDGRTVFICCEACRDAWVNDPDRYFGILDDYLSGKTNSSMAARPSPSRLPGDDKGEPPQMELPRMEPPQPDLPRMNLPQMELPK